MFWIIKLLFIIVLLTITKIKLSNQSDCPNPDDFRCNRDLCIKKSYVCNGEFDCPNKSDEENCDFVLCKPPRWYQCEGNKTCVAQNFRCDGHFDCPHLDDEINCDSNYKPKHEEVQCSINEFTCITDKKCIHLGMVCDGNRNCNDGSDETMGCLDIDKRCANGFLCKNKHCLTDKSWVCDEFNDCGDNSDEQLCPNKCTIENREFLCNNRQGCISIEKVCNKQINDCTDNSDEGGECLKYQNNTDCRCAGGAKCYITPTAGPVCVCPIGFKYNTETKVCDDIDECLQYGICSQGCVNTIGSYRCTCVDNFILKSDNRTCDILSQSDALLLFAGHKAVNAFYLKSKHQFVVSKDVHQVIGVSYDGKYAYWTDIAMRTESIIRANTDGTDIEVILTSGLSAPEDIAVDWITQNIYFTDGAYMHIAVCSSDGYHCTALYNQDVHRPRGICLYPQKGLMYWSDWGDIPMIVSASMDGNQPNILVQKDIHWPNGLALDWPNDRLYWVDAKLKRIDSIKLDGTERRIVLEGVIKHPFGVAIFDNRLFWSDWDTKSIQSCDKFTGKNRDTVVRDRKIYDIHIYHSAIQPKLKNVCIGNPCTHLCLLSANSTYTCACPKGMVLSIDQRTCKSSIKKQTLLLGIGNYLIFWKHQTFGKHDEGHGEPLPMMIHKMAFNSITGDVFIADNIRRAIYTVDLNSKESSALIDTNIGNISSLAFDHLGNNLYWTDIERNTIEIYSLKNKYRAVVKHYIGNVQPLALALLPESGNLFVALRVGGSTHMDMQSMHGRGEHHHIIESGLSTRGKIVLTVNRKTNDVYWLDSMLGNIGYTELQQGLGYQIFLSNIKQPLSLAVLGDELFWTVSKSFKLYWSTIVKSVTSGETKQILIDLPSYVPIPDEIVILATQPLVAPEHICQRTNGDCSHICVPSGTLNSACLCPPGMVFSNSSNKTCIDSIDCEFRCKNGACLTMSRRCNGNADCVDGSDEEDCTIITKPKQSCSYNEFKCLDELKCISQSKRCDMNNDCADKSDELDCNDYDHSKNCHKYQHACGDGRCVDITALCDGYKDCTDGSDEWYCNNRKETNNKNENITIINCDETMFKCSSGQCIPKEWRCDQNLDCTDGSDELYCPKKPCPSNFGTCSNGECIDKRLICDGHNDCGDNSDERNCNNNNSNNTGNDKDNDGMVCGEIVSFDREPTKFQCSSNKSMCLDISVKCNGTAECPRGEDEAECSGCTIHEFECKNKKCIRIEWRCDKETDCDDGSDELNCIKLDGSGQLHSHLYKKQQETEQCHAGMFDCKDGTCIDMHRVCDETADCANKMDESTLCNVSCVSHLCDHKCIATPFGPTCTCATGYTLGGDNKKCNDIDECQSENSPCAQTCQNTQGSFRCSCHSGFYLSTDKVRCKPLGLQKYLLYTSSSTIWKVIPHLEILLQSNTSRITGMDVNIRKNLLYFGVSDSGAIYEYQMDTKELNVIENIGNPNHLAVDWITENVYFIDESSSPSIKICHMSNKICINLYQFKYKDNVKDLIVDAYNRRIFYVLIHYWIYSTAESTIYRHNLDGSNSEILIKDAGHITAITNDINKQIIYYTELHTKSVWSVNYDGSGKRSIIKGNKYITQPNAISFFSHYLTIFNDASKIAVQCKTYGDRDCNSFGLNVNNAENLVIVQRTKQKYINDMCTVNNCSMICVNADNGYNCLCDGGKLVNKGVKCSEYSTNQIKLSPNFKTLDTQVAMPMQESGSSVGRNIGIVFAVLCTTVLFIGLYYVYKRRLSDGRFNIRMYFQNPRLQRNHHASVPPVKMINTPEVRTCGRYNEIFLDTTIKNVDHKQLTAAAYESENESIVDLNQFNENPKIKLIN